MPPLARPRRVFSPKHQPNFRRVAGREAGNHSAVGADSRKCILSNDTEADPWDAMKIKRI